MTKLLNHFLTIICLVTPLTAYADWDKQLNNHQVNKETYPVVFEQYQAYKNNTLPKIADECIKQITIKESGETLVNIQDKNNPFEYWHFSTDDRYAAYWQKPKPMQAVYNRIKATITNQNK